MPPKKLGKRPPKKEKEPSSDSDAGSDKSGGSPAKKKQAVAPAAAAPAAESAGTSAGTSAASPGGAPRAPRLPPPPPGVPEIPLGKLMIRAFKDGVTLEQFDEVLKPFGPYTVLRFDKVRHLLLVQFEDPDHSFAAKHALNLKEHPLAEKALQAMPYLS